MMTEEETINHGTQVAARLRSEESIEDIAAFVVEKVGDIAPEHFHTWCTLFANGWQVLHTQGNHTKCLTETYDLLAKGAISMEECNERRERSKREDVDVARYRKRMQEVNVIVARTSVFTNAFKRFHAWNNVKTPRTP